MKNLNIVQFLRSNRHNQIYNFKSINYNKLQINIFDKICIPIAPIFHFDKISGITANMFIKLKKIRTSNS
jgi:hypothetical protein